MYSKEEKENKFICQVFLDEIKFLNEMFYDWILGNAPQEDMLLVAQWIKNKNKKTYPQKHLTKKIPIVKYD